LVFSGSSPEPRFDRKQALRVKEAA